MLAHQQLQHYNKRNHNQTTNPRTSSQVCSTNQIISTGCKGGSESTLIPEYSQKFMCMISLEKQSPPNLIFVLHAVAQFLQFYHPKSLHFGQTFTLARTTQ
uniref:(northern house mosquito) hypothetical protein n=1 Tax=Culex pipiens TaxID=7175 RepID=A0A8D8BE81_CULPI